MGHDGVVNQSMRRRLSIVVGCVLLVCLLPLTFGRGGGANALDRWCADRVASLLGGHDTVLSILAAPSTPLVVVPAVVAAAVYAWLHVGRFVALAVVAAPLLAVALNTWALKPAFGRHLGDYLAYPSGHTVSLVSAVTAIALVLRRTWIVVVGSVALVCVAIGMIGLGYHHVTDIVGGACVGVAVSVSVLALAHSPAATKQRSDTIA